MPHERRTVGFIGTGVMGASMARNLMNAGFAMCVNTRTRKKAEALLDGGGQWADSPAEVCRRADVVFTMLGYPADVETVYLGPDGLVATSRRGSLLIDCTTSSPDLARRIEAAAAERGIDAMDAPVSGGDVGARNATLSIMCGGPPSAFERALPYLQVIGGNIVHHGPAGSGQHVKAANQIAVANGMLAICEALAYAEKNGLDLRKVLASISSGAAGSWALSNFAPRILAGDFEPGFSVEHLLKDLEIALRECERIGLDLPGLKLARDQFNRLPGLGMPRKGTQALYLLYRDDF